MIKLYDELAAWWPLLSPPEDYAEEAAFFESLIFRDGLPPAPTLLELGCGGGSNAYYFKKRFARVTLTDRSPQMLDISRALNPECLHHQGDMRTLRLEDRFDVVFIHDAIDYMTTAADLALALETAFVHCRPGGRALFVPDYTRETFQPGTEHGGHDGDGRSLRYLEWTFDPDPADTQYTSHMVYLLREGDRPLQSVDEQHRCGLFSRNDWLDLLRRAGFEPERIEDPYRRDLFLARKPASGAML